MGINKPPKSTLEEEETALKQFYKNLKFIDDRYEICRPWKEFPPNLQNNYGLALGRLRSLQGKLTPELFQSYNVIIEQKLQTGIIEEVPFVKRNINKAHYLPHHAVNPRSQLQQFVLYTMVRLVLRKIKTAFKSYHLQRSQYTTKSYRYNLAVSFSSCSTPSTC